jgi:two-component system sensor histidine kinase HydH
MLERVRTQTDELRSTLGERETALREVSADRDHLESHVEHVSDRLADTEDRLVRAERIAAVAQLSGALAHELRNPLHIIRATAETAASRSPDVEDLAEDIKEEVDRVNRLITELLNYSRPSDIQRQQVDLGELLEDVKQRMCRGQCSLDPATCGRCSIVADPTLPPIDADPILLEQAVMNLFANARDVSPEDAKIEMAARRGEPNEVIVTVADRGPGIRAEDRRQVFEPFFTRKEHGTGLGLPVVQRVADLHEGAIVLDEREGGGTIARLRLPTKRPRSAS